MYEDIASYQKLKELVKGCVYQDHMIFPLMYNDLDNVQQVLKEWTLEDYLAENKWDNLSEQWTTLLNWLKTNLKDIRVYLIQPTTQEPKIWAVLGYDKFNYRLGIVGVNTWTSS